MPGGPLVVFQQFKFLGLGTDGLVVSYTGPQSRGAASAGYPVFYDANGNFPVASVAPGSLTTSLRGAGVDLLGLPNGNFEDAVGTPGAAGSYPAGWTPTVTGTGSTLLDTTAANKLTGANSVKMVLAAAADTVTYTGPVFPLGGTIPFFAFLRAKSSGQAARLTVTLNYFTNNGLTANGSATLAQVTGLPAAYAEYGALVTPPAGTSYGQLSWKVDTAADTVWVDEARAARDRVYYDASGSFPTPGIARDRKWMWIDEKNSITGNGTSDDTTAVQAAVNYAIAQGRRLLIPDNIRIRTTAPINVFGSCKINGHGFDLLNGYTASGYSFACGTGSVFVPDHSAAAFLFAGTSGAEGSFAVGEFKNIGIDRPQPVPTSGVAFTPTAHDFDLDLLGGSWVIEDVMPRASTNFLRIRGALQPKINRIKGQVFQVGIQCLYDLDCIRIDNVHFWPYFANTYEVKKYQRANLTALHLLRCDNPKIDNFFSFACLNGVMFDGRTSGATATQGVTSKAAFGKFEVDDSVHGIVTNGASAQYTTAEFAIANFFQNIGDTNPATGNVDSPTTADSLIYNNSDDTEMTIAAFWPGCARGSNAQLLGNRSFLGISRYMEASWNELGSTSSPPAGLVCSQGTSLIEVAEGGWRKATAATSRFSPGQNGGAALASYGAPRASGYVRGTLDRGIASGTTASDGTLKVYHNAGQVPNIVRLNSPGGGTIPVVSLVGNGSDGTGPFFQAKFWDLATGGVIASKTCTVEYQCAVGF